MTFRAPPKNLRLSIHLKYKRRVEHVRYAIHELEHYATEKLQHCGRIYGRRKLELLLEALRALKARLPPPPKHSAAVEVRTTKNLNELLGIE